MSTYFPYMVTVLQLRVTQLQSPNSGRINRTNSKTQSRVSPLAQPCIIPFPIPGSHPYFLICLPFHISFLSIASHYLTCYSLPSHQQCLFVLSYSSLSSPDPHPDPLDFPYTFIIPSRLGKSFVLFSYRLQTI